MLYFAAFSAVACLVLLYLQGRRNEANVWRDWEIALTPRGEKALQVMQRRVEDEMTLVDMALARATELQKLESTQQAIDLLEAGYRVIERFAPNMRRLLAGMALFSRMVAAMSPVKPLKPRQYKIGQLARLAHVQRIVHQFLVSTEERFRFRVYVLRYGFGVLMRYLFGAKERIRASSAASEWEAVVAVRNDLRTLSDESVESFKALLTSLAAVPKDNELILRLPDHWE